MVETLIRHCKEKIGICRERTESDVNRREEKKETRYGDRAQDQREPKVLRRRSVQNKEQPEEETHAEDLEKTEIVLPLLLEVFHGVFRKVGADHLDRTKGRTQSSRLIVNGCRGPDSDQQMSILGEIGGERKDGSRGKESAIVIQVPPAPMRWPLTKT